MNIKYILTAMVLLTVANSSHAAWTSAHGDSDNRSFANVATRPATNVIRTVDVGHVAPGANPVTAPDGTVYIGNTDGKLIALHADGSPYWTRQLNPNHGGIYTAPVVGADGSVYVVSSSQFTEHRTGQVAGIHHNSFLHKFTPGGGWVFPMLFPTISPFVDRGGNTAAPNIWRANGAEAIMVPVVYQRPGVLDLRLIAFSTNGGVLGNQSLSKVNYSTDVTGASGGTLGTTGYFLNCIFSPWNLILPGWECDAGFSPGPYVPPLSDAGFPLPGVAIRPDPLGGMPQVVASGLHDTVVYSFSPAAGLTELVRGTEKPNRFIATPPVVLNNGLTAVGVNDSSSGYPYLRLLQGSNFPSVIPGFYTLTAGPTLLADGRLVVISRYGTLFVLNGRALVMQDTLNGASIASAAASCSHLFVSSENEFRTYDLTNMLIVASVPLQGGRHAPVIGPFGQVYALTEFSLNIFPAPRLRPGMNLLSGVCGGVLPPILTSVLIKPTVTPVIKPIVAPVVKAIAVMAR